MTKKFSLTVTESEDGSWGAELTVDDNGYEETYELERERLVGIFMDSWGKIEYAFFGPELQLTDDWERFNR